MSIENLTLKEIREVGNMLRSESYGKPCPFKIGTAYLIRTVTHYWTGRVIAITGDFLELEDAAWIADTGRYHEAISKGLLGEVEPAGDSIVALGAVIDAVKWEHELSKEVK